MNKKIIFFGIILCLISSFVFAQRRNTREVKKGKMGAEYLYIVNGAINVVKTGSSTEAQKTAPLDGPVFFYERLLGEQFGVEARVGYFQREFKKLVIENKSSTVDEVTIVALFAAKTYFKPNVGKGIRWWASANYGILTAQAKFKIAPDSIQGKTSKSSSQAVGFGVGADYIFTNAGIRGSIIFLNSDFTDSTSIKDYEIYYAYNSLGINLGFYTSF